MVILGATEILGHESEAVGKKKILPESKVMETSELLTVA